MTAYPDLVVKFDHLEPKDNRVVYRWTFVGTNTGPGGTDNQVRISGYEDWKIGPDELIADSKGHYDAQDLGSTSEATLMPGRDECPVTRKLGDIGQYRFLAGSGGSVNGYYR